jgi:hypothetical protein
MVALCLSHNGAVGDSLRFAGSSRLFLAFA